MNIALICSAGGHLTEMLQLESVFRRHPHIFITFKREDSMELASRENVQFLTDPKRNPIKLLKNIMQAASLILRTHPDIVITTGAGTAVPFCYLAKLRGAKIVYIESFCRIDEPSLTGKLLYPIADLFLVQWKELLPYYGKKARCEGGVFS